MWMIRKFDPKKRKTNEFSSLLSWQQNNERFAVYAFDSDAKWYDMTAVDGASNTYKATIDDKYPKVIFCRMNGTTTENKWDNKWNQTIDLTLPTNENSKKPAKSAFALSNAILLVN